ncbi:UNVERIFIED_CONTAM: hypothetical protein GTU68_014954, partial [Idotea baltica]|nr:hypothetical protein [Idotea baltica]
NRVTSPEVSDFFTRIHQEEGVEIICNKKVVELSGSNQVEAVICEDESQYAADLVIIGIGILPNVELAESAGITVENGIVVDEFAQTSDPHIVAAGDCTQHPSHHYGRKLRLESVPNATDQAKSAAASICDQQIPHHNLPWFWSEQYDLKLQIAGIQEGYDQVVLRGDPSIGRNFSAWYFSDGQLIAADCVNDAKAFMVARRLIENGIPVSSEELRDEELDLKGLLKRG